MKKYKLTILIGVLLFMVSVHISKPNLNLSNDDFFLKAIATEKSIANYTQIQKYNIQKGLIENKDEEIIHKPLKDLTHINSYQIIYNSNRDRNIKDIFYDENIKYIDKNDSKFNDMTQKNYLLKDGHSFVSKDFNNWTKANENPPIFSDYRSQLNAFDPYYKNMDISNINSLKMYKATYDGNKDEKILDILNNFGLEDEILSSKLFPEGYKSTDWDKKTVTLRVVFNINNMYIANSYCDLYLEKDNEYYKAYSSTDFNRLNVTRDFKTPKNLPKLDLEEVLNNEKSRI